MIGMMIMNKPSLELEKIVKLIDGNAALQSYRDMVNSVDSGSGYIYNRNTGQEAGVRDSRPYSLDGNVTKAPVDPSQALYDVVQRYNDHILANDLNDNKINLEDYGNPDSPNYLDPNDPQRYDEESRYLKNQLYKLQGDKRHVPTYEDTEEMSDEEFEAYEELLYGS